MLSTGSSPWRGRVKVTPAPPQPVLTNSLGASQRLAHGVIGTHQKQLVLSRSLAVPGAVTSFPGGSRV